MNRWTKAALAALLIASAAQAHFVFVVPAKDGKSVQVVFSDDLDPDTGIALEKYSAIKLHSLSGDKEAALDLKKGEGFLKADLADAQAVRGKLVYGIGKGTPAYLLVYHPKAVIGKPGKHSHAELEAAPVVASGKVRFRLLAKGEPVADSEGSVILPDGKKEKVKTDKDGFTKEFDASGRYGVYLRHIEKKKGDHGGKKYDEVRHYATLVFDLSK